jgi:hypothetical protein
MHSVNQGLDIQGDTVLSSGTHTIPHLATFEVHVQWCVRIQSSLKTAQKKTKNTELWISELWITGLDILTNNLLEQRKF